MAFKRNTYSATDAGANKRRNTTNITSALATNFTGLQVQNALAQAKRHCVDGVVYWMSANNGRAFVRVGEAGIEENIDIDGAAKAPAANFRPFMARHRLDVGRRARSSSGMNGERAAPAPMRKTRPT